MLKHKKLLFYIKFHIKLQKFEGEGRKWRSSECIDLTCFSVSLKCYASNYFFYFGSLQDSYHIASNFIHILPSFSNPYKTIIQRPFQRPQRYCYETPSCQQFWIMEKRKTLKQKMILCELEICTIQKRKKIMCKM